MGLKVSCYLQCCSATKDARIKVVAPEELGLAKEFRVVGHALSFVLLGFCFVLFFVPPFKSYELLCPLSTINMWGTLPLVKISASTYDRWMVVSILRCIVVVVESLFSLGVLSRGPSLSLFDMLLVTGKGLGA
jgi:hypothetical protein